MKKVLFTILALLSFPIAVNAKVDDVDYTIKAFYIDAQLQSNGSMIVKEAIVLSGDYNGYQRDLYLGNSNLTNYNEINFEHSAIYNPSRIELIRSSAIKVKDINFDILDNEFPEFEFIQRDAVGDSGKYYAFVDANKISVRTFNSCYDCKTAFYYEYEIKDIAVLHEDIAEVYYTFIGNGFTDDIKEAQIRVTLPSKGNEDLFRIWAHGNINGEVHFNEDKTGLIATMKKIDKNESMDIRFTFDKDILTETDSLNKTDVEALEQILEVEQKRADEINELREQIKNTTNTLNAVSLVYFIIMVVYFIYIYLKYDKEYETDFDHQYNREFIEDYDIEVIDYLMNKYITPNAMSASIMNMIYKKNITAKEIDKNNYELTLKTEENLSRCERLLVEFLFKKVGSDNKFTLKQLKSYAKSTNTYDKFNSSYDAWKIFVEEEGKKQKFYEDHSSVKIKGVLFGLAGVALFFIDVITLYNPSWCLFIIFPSIMFIIYSICFRKKTMKGLNHYKRWKAFKNFLNDFGTFDTKELPEVALWERYLVYAVIFGLANKVQKVMNVKISEYSTDTLGFDPLYMHMHMNLSHTINSSVSSAINSAVSTAAAQAASSSGSGGGGGFSSGGGFGGGGGGGHGF